jgi:hypothetical protein
VTGRLTLTLSSVWKSRKATHASQLDTADHILDSSTIECHKIYIVHSCFGSYKQAHTKTINQKHFILIQQTTISVYLVSQRLIHKICPSA